MLCLRYLCNSMRLYILYTSVFLLAVVMWLVSGCSSSDEERKTEYRRLDDKAYYWEYRNLDSAVCYAKRALNLSMADEDARTVALNRLADVKFMQMDFTESRMLYMQAMDETDDLLQRFVSEVGLMNVCQRTSQNRSFYEHHYEAESLMRRIEEDENDLDDYERHSFDMARQTFHTVSAQYFLNLRQERRARKEMEGLTADESLLRRDTVQWLKVNYVKSNSRLVEGDSEGKRWLTTFDSLFHGLEISRKGNYPFFEARYLQGLAIQLSNERTAAFLERERALAIHYLTGDSVSEYGSGELLARQALDLSNRYGDLYLQSVSLRVWAACYFRSGHYPEALNALQGALNLVNQHYLAHYRQIPTPHLLELYNPQDSVSVEKQWMDNPQILTMPEWIARIREQLSMVYSALGDKMRSDYNRNVYLDILDVTRQDKEGELRFHRLEKEGRLLNIWMAVVTLSIGGGCFLLYWLSKKWKQLHRSQVRELFTDVRKQAGLWLDGESRSLEDLEEAYEDAASALEMSRRKITQYKTENEDRRACVSLVGEVIPLLDRMLNELRRLKEGKDTAEVRKERYVYICELTEKINEYNDLLTHWIQIRKGTFNLRVETFSVKEVLDVLRLRQGLFERGGKTLEVSQADYKVKADKALTLFMLNTLVENAYKYAGEKGKTAVEAVEGSDYVELSIKDNGPGLSEEDRQRIVNQKVYDAASIGMVGDAERDSRLQEKKGFGFGLMNCKGIIEKYRKTNSFFACCLFGVESEKGKGCRFFFRLPKAKSLLVVLLLLTAGMGLNGCTSSDKQPVQEKDVLWKPDDALLRRASGFADSVYYCNIDARYEQALAFADSARGCLNAYYLAHHPGSVCLMRNRGNAEQAAELYWWEEGFNTDYHVILDIRNESAVAALALKDWTRYRYDNDIYTVLYKVLGEDSSLGLYSQSMQRSSSNKIVLLMVFVVSALTFFIAYYILYFRRRRLFRIHLRQLLQLNTDLASLSCSMPEEGSRLVDTSLPQVLLRDLNEIVPLEGLVLLVNDTERNSMDCLYAGEVVADRRQMEDGLRAVLNGKKLGGERQGQAFPLDVRWQGKVYRVGVLWLGVAGRADATLKPILALAVRSVAACLFHSVVQVGGMENKVELMRDEVRKASQEASRLHVQNQVLDNCLSAIKHETMFYPSRILQLVEKIKGNVDKEEERRLTAEMAELAIYYKDIYTLLGDNARRQLTQVVFHRETLEAERLYMQAERLFHKLNKRHTLEWTEGGCQEGGLCLKGDGELLSLLFRNLLEAALSPAKEGTLSLTIRRWEHYVRFELKDSRSLYSADTLRLLFSPDLCELKSAEGQSVEMKYLVCKQIIRDHGEYTAQRGCRINAEPMSEGGYVVWFTLPLVVNKD